MCLTELEPEAVKDVLPAHFSDNSKSSGAETFLQLLCTPPDCMVMYDMFSICNILHIYEHDSYCIPACILTCTFELTLISSNSNFPKSPQTFCNYTQCFLSFFKIYTKVTVTKTATSRIILEETKNVDLSLMSPRQRGQQRVQVGFKQSWSPAWAMSPAHQLTERDAASSKTLGASSCANHAVNFHNAVCIHGTYTNICGIQKSPAAVCAVLRETPGTPVPVWSEQRRVALVWRILSGRRQVQGFQSASSSTSCYRYTHPFK